MALGDRKGGLTGTGLSVTNPSTATGSVSVAAGDLIYGTFCQQTGLTATTVTDNLGNAYTAVNAGLDPGTPTGRSYWSVVTVAGTLTTISVAATASANDYVVAFDVFTGPFANFADKAASADVDDHTTPYAAPATGTLTYASEIVCSSICRAGTGTFSATAPTLKGGEVTSTNAAVTIGYQVVSSTASVTPAFTGTASTNHVLNTCSFADAASVPPGAAFRSISGTNYGAHAGGVTVNAPAGVQNGDFLVAIVNEGNAWGGGVPVEIPISGPAGWTHAWTSNYGDGGSYQVFAHVWTKVASSEPSTYTWTYASDPGATQALVLAFTGAASLSPTPTSANNGTDAPSITAPAGATIIFASWDWGGSGNLVPPTGTNPTFIERWDTTQAEITYIATGDMPSGGATGTRGHSLNGIPALQALISVAAATGATGTLVTTEAADTSAIAGLVGRTGTLAVTEAADTAAIVGGIVATGTLVTTEASDVSALAGLVGCTGILAAIEAADTAALAGTVGAVAATGTLAATEAADTAAIAGGIIATGTLVTTEAADTAAIAGGIVATGSLVTTESADIAAFAGNIAGLPVTGTLAVTEAADVAAFTSGWSVFTTQTPIVNSTGDGPYEMGMLFKSSVPGKIVAIRFYKEATEGSGHTGNIWLNSTQALLTSAAFSGEASSGWVTQYLPTPLDIIADTLYMVSVNTAGQHYVATTFGLDAPGVSNGPLTTDGVPNGFYGSPGVFPTSTYQNTNYFRDVIFAPGVAAATGTFAITEAADTAACAGSVAWLPATGTLVATEAADTTALAGGIVATATLAATEASDTAAIAGGLAAVTGTLAATEAADISAIMAGGITTGALAATEAKDTAAIVGSLVIGGSLAAVEAADAAASNGQVVWLATLAASEARDTAVIAGAVKWNAVLAAVEAGDIAVVTGGIAAATGVLAASEARDTASVSGQVRWLGTLAAIEAADTSSINAGVSWRGTLVAIEAADIAEILGEIKIVGQVQTFDITGRRTNIAAYSARNRGPLTIDARQ